MHALRNRLDPIVYRDFIQRVAILGGESTGKTFLARHLAKRLSTVHAAEFRARVVGTPEGRAAEADMLHIAQTQVRREETLALKANRLVICDTTPLTTKLYSQAMFGHVAAELETLAQRSYDLTLLCVPDVPFVQDGTRRDAVLRQWQHDWYVRELEARRIEYRLLQGGWEERLATAIDCISIAGGAGTRFPLRQISATGASDQPDRIP